MTAIDVTKRWTHPAPFFGKVPERFGTPILKASPKPPRCAPCYPVQ